jgi:hypothetical protein
MGRDGFDKDERQDVFLLDEYLAGSCFWHEYQTIYVPSVANVANLVATL